MNRELPSLHGRLLKITLTVPLNMFQNTQINGLRQVTKLKKLQIEINVHFYSSKKPVWLHFLNFNLKINHLFSPNISAARQLFYYRLLENREDAKWKKSNIFVKKCFLYYLFPQKTALHVKVKKIARIRLKSYCFQSS